MNLRDRICYIGLNNAIFKQVREPTEGVLQHFRNHHQPHVLQVDVCDTLPQQDGPSARQGRQAKVEHQGLLPRVRGRPLVAAGRAKVSDGHAPGPQPVPRPQNLLPLYHCRWYREYHGCVHRRQGHDTRQESWRPDAPVKKAYFRAFEMLTSSPEKLQFIVVTTIFRFFLFVERLPTTWGVLSFTLPME